MSALPVLQPQPDRQLPDYLPARMVNEFVYCPRLFFYEWVEGVFRQSVDTVEGQAQHRRVDRESKGMPAADDLGDQTIHTRSVTLSSERLRVIATIQREQKDVLAGVSQLDGVQLLECPDKQTRGDQDEKRDRDLGDHQNVLRAAARSASAAILQRGHHVRTRRLNRRRKAK